MNCLAPSITHSPSSSFARRAGVAGIRAGLGLGQAEGGEPLARAQLRHPLVLLLVGAPEVDRHRPERGVGGDRDRDRRVDPGELLDGERVGEVVGAAAAVLLGEGDPHQPELAHLRDELVGEGLRPVELLGDAAPPRWRAKSRTVSRSRRCSSFRSKSMGAAIAAQPQRLRATRPLGRSTGRPEQEALAEAAAELEQAVELLVPLDPLGDDAQPRLGPRSMIARASAESSTPPPTSSTNGFGDLQHVDREAAQVLERGVAGAEVVDRELDAERLSSPGARPIGSGSLHEARSRSARASASSRREPGLARAPRATSSTRLGLARAGRRRG